MNGCRNNYFSRQSELYTWILGGGRKQGMCQQYSSLRKDNTWRWIDMRSYTPAKHCVHIVCKLVDSREILTFTSHSGKGGKSSYFLRSYTGSFRRNFRQATLINEKSYVGNSFLLSVETGTFVWRFHPLLCIVSFVKLFQAFDSLFFKAEPLLGKIFCAEPNSFLQVTALVVETSFCKRKVTGFL